MSIMSTLKKPTPEREGDVLAEFVAKVLIEDFNPDSALGDGGQIAHLTAILDQAITDLNMVCDALESWSGAREEAAHG